MEVEPERKKKKTHESLQECCHKQLIRLTNGLSVSMRSTKPGIAIASTWTSQDEQKFMQTNLLSPEIFSSHRTISTAHDIRTFSNKCMSNDVIEMVEGASTPFAQRACRVGPDVAYGVNNEVSLVRGSSDWEENRRGRLIDRKTLLITGAHWQKLLNLE
jgi:hypothetical protein